MNINFTCSLYFFNVSIRKFKITYVLVFVAHIFLLDSTEKSDILYFKSLKFCYEKYYVYYPRVC